MKRKMLKRLLALLVIVCLIFSLLPTYAVVIDENVNGTDSVLPVKDDSMEALRSSLSPVMPNLNKYVLSEGDLTTDALATAKLDTKDIPEIMRNEDFDTSFHVNRLYEQEEDLNTVLFQNVDGTKTMYMYPFEVKQENEFGVVEDKSIAVIQKDYEVENSGLIQMEQISAESGNVASVASFSNPVIEHDGETGIHDVSILEALPDYCTGGALRTYIGPHGTLGRTKMFIRFPYLVGNTVYDRISAGQIVSAEYKVYKTAAEYATSFNVYWYTGDYWTEELITFNSPATVHSYSIISGTSSQTVPAAAGWVNIDVTKAVTGWKNGTNGINKGLVMFAAASQIDNGYGQSFYSVEGGLAAGNKVPCLNITWKPATQISIQDGGIYAIKNKNGKYLTVNGTNVNLESKKYAYFDNNGNKGSIDYSTLDPSQLWVVTSIEDEVYRLYSVNKVYSELTISQDIVDGYVLSTNGSQANLSRYPEYTKTKWILQKYGGKIYFINAEYDDHFLGAEKNTGNLVLTKEDENLTWDFELVNLVDSYSDVLPKMPGDMSGVVFNFIIYDSAIFGNYNVSVYENAIEKWSGISTGLVLRVYTEHDENIPSADRTVRIKGYSNVVDGDGKSAFAVTEIQKDENGVQVDDFQIKMNRSKTTQSALQCEKVVKHEMGHAFLLTHPDEGRYNYVVASIMNTEGAECATTEITQYDKYNLKRVWG